jgi:hypothetical protein
VRLVCNKADESKSVSAIALANGFGEPVWLTPAKRHEGVSWDFREGHLSSLVTAASVVACLALIATLVVAVRLIGAIVRISRYGAGRKDWSAGADKPHVAGRNS